MNSLLGNQSFRDYQIKEVIGTGGFGVVYLAHQPVINRDVAIKAILPEYANEPEFVRRFEREAQFVARLEHLHIVPIYDYWRDPHGAYIVMRMFKGGNLAQSLYQDGPWELPLVVRLVDQIAAALYVAHQEGIIHQDIKPENILLDEDGNGYLTDFGIAKNIFDDSTYEKKRYGSPAYTSPENMTGGIITPQSDIYSFGVLTYSMFAGLPKATTASESNGTRQLRAAERRPLFEVRPDLPEGVGDVIFRATHENAHLRHPDAYSFAVDLRTALQLPEGDYIRPILRRSPSLNTETPDGGQDTQAFDLGTGTISFVTGTQTVNLPSIVNPYKGLRPFEEADSGRFYGRDNLIRRLINRLDEEDSDHFLAVVGASGSGKSSVVKAGVIPLLRMEALPQSDRWFITTMVPGPAPFKELEQALLRVAIGMPEGELADYFRASEAGLHNMINEILPGDNANLFLFIDQFEEIFLQSTEEDRTHFLNNLVYALTVKDSHFWLVVTLRADFYDRPLSVPNFGELMQKHTEVVLPLSVEELKDIIERPALGAGLEIEPELVIKIIDDVHHQPGALPLLQFALTELFELQEKNTLMLESYNEIGGVSGALAKRAEMLFQELGEEKQALVRQLFLRLVTLGEGSDDTRRRAPQYELTTLGGKVKSDMVQEVINLFSRYRLLTLDRDPETRTPTIEIAHEALIRQWQRLRDWLDSGRDVVRLQRRLAASTSEWHKSENNASFLASGARLAQFESLLTSDDITLNEDERDYLSASVRLRQRSINRIKMFIAALAFITLFAIGMAVLAFSRQQAAQNAESTAVAERNRANEKANIARSGELAVLALTGRERLDTSLLLSVEAFHIYDTLEARRSLLNTLSIEPRLNKFMVGHDSGVRSVKVSDDGTIIVTAGDDGTIILWDGESNKQIERLSDAHNGVIRSITLSDDGAMLASAGDDGNIIVWSLSDYSILHTLEAHTGSIRQIAFRPDDDMLASAGDDGQVILWDLSSAEPQILRDSGSVVYSVEFSSNGRYLAAGGEDQIVRLWDLSSDDMDLTELAGHENWVMTLAFSPNGNLLASSGPENDVFLWNVAEKTGLGKFPTGHTNWVRDVVFSPSAPVLAIASQDNTISLWNLSPIEQLAAPLALGHTGNVLEITFSPDGQQLISASLDGSSIIWSIESNHRLLERLAEHDEEILDVAISDDGQLVAFTGGNAGSGNNAVVRLWSMASGEELTTTLKGHVGVVASLAFSPRDSTLISGGEDDSLILWDVETGEIQDQLVTHRSNVNSIAFNRDGELFASADDAGVILLWHKDVVNKTWVADEQKLANGVRDIVFSPDGQILAVADEGHQITLWDTTTFEMIGEPLTAHEDVVTSLDFSPDGRLLASGSYDNTVIIWDVLRQTPIDQPLAYHTHLVNSVVFHPTDLILASGGGDGLIVLWDIARMQRIGTAFNEHDGWVNDLTFASDGTQLISAGADGQLLMWDVDVATWEDKACQIANRNLTQVEWDIRMGDFDYREICP